MKRGRVSVVGALAAMIAAPAAMASSPWEGPWCDDTGGVMIDIRPGAFFFEPQTRCDVQSDVLQTGVFEGDVLCETALYLNGDQAAPEIVVSLATLGLRPLDNGRLGMRLGETGETTLMHCHAVWPL